jgi:hypothetical protein
MEGTKGDVTPHKESAIRRISSHEIDPVYEEAWDLLNGPVDEAPVRVPERILERGGSEIGWPDRHPGLSARH